MQPWYRTLRFEREGWSLPGRSHHARAPHRLRRSPARRRPADVRGLRRSSASSPSRSSRSRRSRTSRTSRSWSSPSTPARRPRRSRSRSRSPSSARSSGTPQRARAAVDHLVRPVAGDRHLRGRRRHLLRAPAGRRAPARRRRARRASSRTLGPNDTPVGQIYQYTLESDHHTPERAAQLAGLGRLEAPHARRRRRRRRELRRLPEGVPRPRRPGAAAQQRAHAARTSSTPSRGSNGATSGGYLASRRVASSSCAGAATCATPRDIENTVVARAERHAGPRAQRRARSSRRYTPRRGAVARGDAIDSIEGTILLRRGENPKDVLDGVHEAVERINKDVLPPGMKIVPFYDRTRLVDTTLHTVGAQHARGRGRSCRLVLWLFLRAVSGSIAVAVTMPLALLTAFVGPLLRGRAGEPALDGRDRLRHPARRRRHPRRERLPPPRRGAAAARATCRDVVARAAKEVVRPTLFSMSIIVGGDDADLHARARRGPHLPPGRADLRVRARRRAALHADGRAGAHDGAAQEPQGQGGRARSSSSGCATRYLAALRVALRYPIATRARAASSCSRSPSSLHPAARHRVPAAR